MIEFLRCFGDLFIQFMNDCDLAIYIVACIILGCIFRLFLTFLGR